MKAKVLSLLTALVFLTTTLSAQDTITKVEVTPKAEKTFTRHEVSLSYGVLAFTGMTEITTVFGKVLTAPLWVLTNGSSVDTIVMRAGNYSGSGSINFDYSYHFTRMFAINANLSYNRGNMTYQRKHSDNVFYDDGRRIYNFITAMVGFKFDWVSRPHFGFYSRIMAGAMIVNSRYKGYENSIMQQDNYNRIVFMGHFSPVGIEFGGKALRGFTEIGVGQNGVLQAGVRYKFD